MGADVVYFARVHRDVEICLLLPSLELLNAKDLHVIFLIHGHLISFMELSVGADGLAVILLFDLILAANLSKLLHEGWLDELCHFRSLEILALLSFYADLFKLACQRLDLL